MRPIIEQIQISSTIYIQSVEPSIIKRAIKTNIPWFGTKNKIRLYQLMRWFDRSTTSSHKSSKSCKIFLDIWQNKYFTKDFSSSKFIRAFSCSHWKDGHQLMSSYSCSFALFSNGYSKQILLQCLKTRIIEGSKDKLFMCCIYSRGDHWQLGCFQQYFWK